MNWNQCHLFWRMGNLPYARKNSWDSSQNPKFISLISGWLSNFDESLWFPQSFHLLTICQSKINTIFSSIECLSFVSKSVFQLNFLLILFESSDKYVVIKMHQVKNECCIGSLVKGSVYRWDYLGAQRIHLQVSSSLLLE